MIDNRYCWARRGEAMTGSDAVTVAGGQLNPAFSAWVMGYPEAWCLAALSCQHPRPLRKSRSVGRCACGVNGNAIVPQVAQAFVEAVMFR